MTRPDRLNHRREAIGSGNTSKTGPPTEALIVAPVLTASVLQLAWKFGVQTYGFGGWPGRAGHDNEWKYYDGKPLSAAMAKRIALWRAVA